MNSVNGEGRDRPAREAGRRNHAWVILEPGLAECERCKLIRIYTKQGGKRWKTFYQTPGKRRRPLGKSRRVPDCE